MNALLESLDRVLAAEPGNRDRELRDLASAVVDLRESQFAHFDYEEANFLPVLAELDLEQHLEMLRSAYDMCVLERPHLIGIMASYMPIENTLSLLDSLLYAVTPDSGHWRQLVSEVHRCVRSDQWLRVVRRFEDVLPTTLMVVPCGHGRRSIGEVARALETTAPIERLEIPVAPDRLSA